MSDKSDDTNVYLIYECNQWKEWSSMKLLAATTDKTTVYAMIGHYILAGTMNYKGKSDQEGFLRYHEDYKEDELELSALDYGFVGKTVNELVSDCNEKPYDRITGLLDMDGEEVAAEFDRERNLLKGIPPGRVRMILDKVLADYAERAQGEELYDLLRIHST